MTTPYIILTIPTPTVTPGPTYAQNIAAALSLIDSHDHSVGKGAPLKNNLYLGLAQQSSDPLAGDTTNTALWVNNSGVLMLHLPSGSSVQVGSSGITTTTYVATSTYTVLSSDQNIVVKNQGCVVSLPSIAGGATGRTLTIKYGYKQSYSNFIKLVPNGGDTVDGMTKLVITNYQQAITLIAGSDNNWSASGVRSNPTDQINVRDFGAIGDGIIDDTIAIQAAIDYSQQTAYDSLGISRTPVYFPHGEYLISSTLTNVNYIRGERSVIRSNTAIDLLHMSAFRTRVDNMAFKGGANQIVYVNVTGDHYINNSEFQFYTNSGACIGVTAIYSGANFHIDNSIFDTYNGANVDGSSLLIPTLGAIFKGFGDEIEFTNSTFTTTNQYPFIVSLGKIRFRNTFGLSYYSNNISPTFVNPMAWLQATNTSVVFESCHISDGNIPIVEFNSIDNAPNNIYKDYPNTSFIFKDTIASTLSTAFVFNQLPSQCVIENIVGLTYNLVFGPNITDAAKLIFANNINSNFKVDSVSGLGGPIGRWTNPATQTANYSSNDVNMSMIVAHIEDRKNTTARSIAASDYIGSAFGTTQILPGAGGLSSNVTIPSSTTIFGESFQNVLSSTNAGTFLPTYFSGLYSVLSAPGAYTVVFNITVESDHIIPFNIRAGSTTVYPNLTRGEHQIRVPFVINKLPKKWTATTAYSVNDVIYTTGALPQNSGYSYICIQSGTSGVVQPSAVYNLQAPFVDGTVKWIQVEHATIQAGTYTAPAGALFRIGKARIFRGSYAGSQALNEKTYSSAVPTSGFWTVGDIVTNSNYGTASPIREWVCNQTGSAVKGAWLINTPYLAGDQVTAAGNVYLCTKSGTSAGAGGPTGLVFPGDYTTTRFVDNTCEWQYYASAATLAIFTDVRSAFNPNPSLQATCGVSPVISNNSLSAVLFDTVSRDTSSAYNTGTGIYTVAANKNGDYVIDTQINWTTTPGALGLTTLYVYKNSTIIAQYTVENTRLTLADTIREGVIFYFAVGDTIIVKVLQTSGASLNISNTIGSSILSIKRLPD